MDYETIKTNYLNGLWSKALVLIAVRKGVITREQADEIFAAKEELQ